jgi:hypothetical protein
MARTTVCQVGGKVVALVMLGALPVVADELRELKAAAGRYVTSIKAVLALPKSANCSEISLKAGEYASTKVAYYAAARKAMPLLIRMVKGEKTDSPYGEDLIELFRGSGEEEDQQATIILESGLRSCESPDQPIQTRKSLKEARQAAEDFLRDFGRLEGA